MQEKVQDVETRAIADSSALLSLFDELTEKWTPGESRVAQSAPSSSSRYLDAARRLHEQNLFQWDREAEARRAGDSPDEVARCKLAIDESNLARHMLVEELDQGCVSRSPKPAQLDPDALPDLFLSSETVGQMVDRLSILTLRLQHYLSRGRWTLAGDHELAADLISRQRRIVAICYDRFVSKLQAGEAYILPYRSFKAYD
jgi:hypothetical protein